MSEKDIRKLGRGELLELLLEQTEENERLRDRLRVVERELENRRIALDSCGSIAEACLKLSGIFEVAQQAADSYLENVSLYTEDRESVFRRIEVEAQQSAENMIAVAERKCALLEEETKRKCDEMVRVARRQADGYWNMVSTRRESQLNDNELTKEDTADE